MTDPQTLAVYDAQAAEYARVTEQNRRDPALRAFIAALPKGGLALDLGCGPGFATAEMVAQGLRAEGWDASAEMIRLATDQPGVIAHQRRFDDLIATNHYDGIWANFSLLHAPRADFPRLLAAIHQALKPNGVFHIALKTGQGEARDKIGRRYSYFEPQDLRDLLTDAGFTITATRTGRDTGLDGSVSDWISYLCHG